MSIQRWSLCRQCGMVKDTGKAHGEYSKYEEEGPYYVLYADHVAAIEHLERVHQNEINELRWFNQVTRDDSFAAGFAEAVQECIDIASQEKFLDDSGKQIPAMGALWNIIVKMQDLRGIK